MSNQGAGFARPTGLPLGLAGATAATRYAGGTASGAPVSGTFQVGDEVPSQDGHLWLCIVAGTPGTWVDAGTYGVGNILADPAWTAKGQQVVATANGVAAVVNVGATGGYWRVVGGTAVWVTQSAATPAATATAGSAGTAANPPSADDHAHLQGIVTTAGDQLGFSTVPTRIVGPVTSYLEQQVADTSLAVKSGWGIPRIAARRTGSIRSTISRPEINASSLTGQTSGTLRLYGLQEGLAAGEVISSITFVSGAVAYIAGTGSNYQWFALYDAALNLLAYTANDGSTAWAANAEKTLAIAFNSAGGAIGSYTIVTSGFFYLGVLVNSGVAGTTPAFIGANPGGTTANALAPVLCGNSTSGLATATPPNPAAAISATLGPTYAYVS